MRATDYILKHNALLCQQSNVSATVCYVKETFIAYIWS